MRLLMMWLFPIFLWQLPSIMAVQVMPNIPRPYQADRVPNAGVNVSTQTIQLTSPTGQPSSQSLGFGAFFINQGAPSKSFTIYDESNAVVMALCPLPDIEANATQPGIALGVQRSCRRRTYQYAFISFTSPTKFSLGVSHT